MMTAIIVGGAYFGDNLSFISDTTVVATQTQGCRMSDKFRVNSLIVGPAALIILGVYAVMGIGLQAPTDIADVEYVKVLPYILVLVCAIAGMNVMAVLAMGTILCGVIGVASYYLGSPLSYDLFGWFSAMGNGITGMGELVIIAMMAGGMLCTANNTVAILTVGNIAKKIGDKFGVDNRKAASILDTFSCMVQGMIPYGVQMLLAAGLAGISPMDILPYLYYPVAIGIAAFLAIIFRYPKRYN